MERKKKESKLTAPVYLEPQYSRPLDVHRFSEHTEIDKLTAYIWGNLNAKEPAMARPTGGVKPKADNEAQLRVLLLDLYVAWKTDPGLSIGVHLSNTAWNTNSRYNALHLSRKIPGLVHRLHEADFIQLSKGSYSGPGAPTNRTARIIAAEPLRKLFREAKFGLEHITVCSDRESIVMHSEKGGHELEYKDTEATNVMREDLRRYNALLSQTFIDVPDQDQPFIERPIKQGRRKGEKARVSICHLDNFVRRIFNRGKWSGPVTV